jgi:hypothetical protein
MAGIKKIRAPYWDAKKAFKEYAAAAELHPEMPEYEHLAKAYGVMARYGEILHIGQALNAGGLNEFNVPRLAIARADAREVEYAPERWDTNHNIRGHYFEMMAGSHAVRGRKKNLWFPLGTIADDNNRRAQHRYRAIAPLIPPKYLPKAKLSNYYLLWEAEWTRGVPIDPILMRHVSGPFYQPLYQWDLTELEQMVLRERLIPGRNEPVGAK